MTTTTTHTYTVVRFADPYLVCEQCRARAEGYINAPGHEEHMDNWPCQHRAPITSLCPSWGPVDGCQCAERLGHVPHPVLVVHRLDGSAA